VAGDLNFTALGKGSSEKLAFLRSTILLPRRSNRFCKPRSDLLLELEVSDMLLQGQEVFFISRISFIALIFLAVLSRVLAKLMERYDMLP